MIISPSRYFVFVHPPKTGGTAISLAYEERARPDDLLFGDTPKATKRQGNFNRKHPHRKLSKHATLQQAMEAVPQLQLAGFRVAITVRNPWDRMVSFYTWARSQGFDHPMIAAAKDQDFATFLSDARVRDPFKRYGTQCYAEPASAIILRQERLAEDWRELCEILEFPAPALEKTNLSDRPRDWRAFYTDETAALIPDLFRWEVGALGYTFEK